MVELSSSFSSFSKGCVGRAEGSLDTKRVELLSKVGLRGEQGKSINFKIRVTIEFSSSFVGNGAEILHVDPIPSGLVRSEIVVSSRVDTEKKEELLPCALGAIVFLEILFTSKTASISALSSLFCAMKK